ncbi:TetR/AcrR family transcriptional regulator [Burkholderia sp. F1]|uniref:TetR/AcrR family transcriptional regulator n=1 Tax=Burkholderia sp. F1 TaxID=3366817 RepID=UPI003D755FCE
MRKSPVQARSRATLEAILDATAHILGAHGWAGVSTNSVAEKAGVSIGSLYQYFPNKAALVTAVRKRHFDEVLAVLKTATNNSLSRAARVSAFVDGMIAVHARHPAAHRVLLEGAPENMKSSDMDYLFETAYRQGCENFFVSNARDHRSSDPRIPALVLSAAVAGAIHEAARQDFLNSLELKAELVRLVESFLIKRRS